ncbi:glycerol-3-phosphate 1-O-acyltransferase PlsY [Streptococcus porcinus]|uniref:Glycerol-3-phosphate acyltransferase n=1 Tax=Streptococcus porcinus str. Jelinkova 176 TaxID=873448 RepID=A0ABN0CX50_STRPO|nr:glycerol-3-phosphate 1-O-acyltransferase PlsY [Streptococcus porcinus]EGJ27796.1 acyl-phosphate glycerol 3-phosphate acyltransferase [Streptococcus porcinus str. Jelinkova 176]SQG43906.1 acyl-phosphate glycerol 3-phosphate acyltransferase [Streptococcus porcinus]
MKLTFLIIIAYLLGSIPTGLWIGQYFYHINLREHGSGNTGTTNTFRILGIKAGLATLAIDILKGTIATLLPIIFGVTFLSPIIFGFFAVVGHTFPLFAKFKGGKAVATSAGVILGYSPLYVLFLAIIFLVILYLFSMISLSSICTAIIAAITVLFFPRIHFLLNQPDPILLVIVISLAVLIIYRHKDNIQRIRSKKENLVPWGLNLSHQKKS